MNPGEDGARQDARGKPIPLDEPHMRPYWEAARRREFVIQHCDVCRLWIHPPRFACPRCQTESLGWKQPSGAGQIYAFSVMYMAGVPGYPETPYAVAVVELDEQPGLITVGNVLGSEPSALRVGDRVQVDFEDIGEGWVLPQWRRAGA